MTLSEIDHRKQVYQKLFAPLSLHLNLINLRETAHVFMTGASLGGLFLHGRPANPPSPADTPLPRLFLLWPLDVAAEQSLCGPGRMAVSERAWKPGPEHGACFFVWRGRTSR